MRQLSLYVIIKRILSYIQCLQDSTKQIMDQHIGESVAGKDSV